MTNALDRDLLEASNPECSTVRELMLGEADRELSPADADRIEAHVGTCDACLSLLSGEDERLALPSEVVDPAPWTPPQPAEWLRVEGPHRDEPTPAETNRWPAWRWVGALAAVVLGAILLRQVIREPENPGDPNGPEISSKAGSPSSEDRSDDPEVSLASEDDWAPEDDWGFVQLINTDDVSVEIQHADEDEGAVIIFVNEF